MENRIPLQPVDFDKDDKNKHWRNKASSTNAVEKTGYTHEEE